MELVACHNVFQYLETACEDLGLWEEWLGKRSSELGWKNKNKWNQGLKMSSDENGKHLRIEPRRQAALISTLLQLHGVLGRAYASCHVWIIWVTANRLLMRMGVADVYFGLCHMAAHVDLLIPKDDSNLEVERALAMAPCFFLYKELTWIWHQVLCAPGNSGAQFAIGVRSS